MGASRPRCSTPTSRRGTRRIHTGAIPPSGEAAHVIDGLLYHEADLNVAVHHTDGGGVSDHVFALAHLLGFRFAPRIPNLADRRLYAFGPASTWPALAPFIAGRPDDKLITAHWDDVLRLTTSVRTGHGQRLADAQAPGRLPAAERVGTGAARDRAHRANPARPRLAGGAPTPPAGDGGAEQGREPQRAVPAPCASTVSGGCATARPKLQQHRASGLALVTAAIALWNTVYLGRALDAAAPPRRA